MLRAKMFRLVADRMEASAFKPVEGGYLFQPMIGWRLGRSPCYLVTDAQKAMIAARLTKNMKAMRPFQIAYLTAFLAVTALLLFAQWELFTAMMTAIVGTGTAFVIAMLIYARRTLGPLLDGLPIANERISLNDRLEQQSKVLSSRILLLVALAAILIALVSTFLELPILAGRFYWNGSVVFLARIPEMESPRALNWPWLKSMPASRRTERLG